MNKEMKKRIVGVTTILITLISFVSIMGFFINTGKSFEVVRGSKELNKEIKTLHNDYIIPLYKKITSEDTSKSLSENSAYYIDILDKCKEITVKEDELIEIANDINNVKIGNYLSDSKSFICSVEKVYTLLKEGSEGDFSNLDNISEEQSSSYINLMKSNYDLLVRDYEELKLQN